MVFCDWILWLSPMFSRFIYVVARFSTWFLFMPASYPIIWMYHILCIHLLMDTWVPNTFCYMQCCHNIHVQVFVRIYAFSFLGIYLGVELLAHLVTLCLIINGTVRLFSKAVASLYILTALCKGSDFFTSLPTFIIIWVFCSAHPSECVISVDFCLLNFVASNLIKIVLNSQFIHRLLF